MSDHPHTKPDPTPEQIRQRCEAIRATWSRHERAKRCLEAKRVEFEPVKSPWADLVEVV